MLGARAAHRRLRDGRGETGPAHGARRLDLGVLHAPLRQLQDLRRHGAESVAREVP